MKHHLALFSFLAPLRSDIQPNSFARSISHITFGCVVVILFRISSASGFLAGGAS